MYVLQKSILFYYVIYIMVFSKKSNTKKNAGKRLTRRGSKRLKKTSKKRGYKKTKGGYFDFLPDRLKPDPRGVMLTMDHGPELYNDVKKIITSDDGKEIITSDDGKVINKVPRLVKTKKTKRLDPLHKGTYGPLNCNYEENGCYYKAILLTDNEVQMFKDNNIKKIYEQISIPYDTNVNVYYVKYNPNTNEIVKNENFDAEVAAAETKAAKTKVEVEAAAHRKEVKDTEAAEARGRELQARNEEFFKNQEAEREAKLAKMTPEQRNEFLEKEARKKRLAEAAEKKRLAEAAEFNRTHGEGASNKPKKAEETKKHCNYNMIQHRCM
jgi:hypothetical protein